MERRGFLAGVAAFLAAPAIIRTPGLLMPVKAIEMPVGVVVRAPSLSEIVTITLRNRSERLAENIARNNALLERLRGRDGNDIGQIDWLRVRLPA